jgi:M6 family metalloprotease-like protein
LLLLLGFTTAAALGTAGPAFAAEYPSPPPDFAHPDSPHSLLYSPDGGNTDRPMLVIYAQFGDRTFGDTSPPGLDAAYMADRFFGPFPSVADFFADDSSGHLILNQAPESNTANNGVMNDGVVSVTIQGNKSDFNSLAVGEQARRLLQAADPFVDFAGFDRDGDGTVAEDELVVSRQDVDTDPVGPGCAVTRDSASVTLDGVQLGGLSMTFGGTDTNLITIVHETGHVAFDMPDLYFWISGYRFDPAVETCGLPDDSLFRFNAWQKLHIGWSTPTVVTSDGFYDVRRPPATSGASFILYDPDKGTDHYFVVENRGQVAGTYDQRASDTGLVIWRLEDDEYVPVGEGEAELGPDEGFIALVRPIGGRAWDPSDPSTPQRTMERDWRDGTASRVAVRAMPAAGDSMRVFFDVRGPGVLVDALTAEGLTMRVDVTPDELNRPPVTVMNTGEETDSFRFFYETLPAGWDSVAHSQTLDANEQGVSQAAIVPAADAPTGVYQVTIVGRSNDDASITSQASLELNVVLDRTEIVYTGATNLPIGEPAGFSALVTNPDDEGAPPVEGAEVTFQMTGDGGTQTATATTGPEGIASADPIVTVPPGNYQLTVSTARLGKHAPASITVPVRVPTAAERIEDLLEDVIDAGLPRGTEQSLSVKLERAHAKLAAGNTTPACNTLRAFINEVRALRGHKIPSATADQFIADAESIRRQLNCADPPAAASGNPGNAAARHATSTPDASAPEGAAQTAATPSPSPNPWKPQRANAIPRSNG